MGIVKRVIAQNYTNARIVKPMENNILAKIKTKTKTKTKAKIKTTTKTKAKRETNPKTNNAVGAT